MKPDEHPERQTKHELPPLHVTANMSASNAPRIDGCTECYVYIIEASAVNVANIQEDNSISYDGYWYHDRLMHPLSYMFAEFPVYVCFKCSLESVYCGLSKVVRLTSKSGMKSVTLECLSSKRNKTVPLIQSLMQEDCRKPEYMLDSVLKIEKVVSSSDADRLVKSFDRFTEEVGIHLLFFHKFPNNLMKNSIKRRIIFSIY